MSILYQPWPLQLFSNWQEPSWPFNGSTQNTYDADRVARNAIVHISEIWNFKLKKKRINIVDQYDFAYYSVWYITNFIQ